MERGRLLVTPKMPGARRHKALAPWRFQRGFVRRQVKAAAPNGRDGGEGFEAFEAIFDAEGRGPGAGGGSEFERSRCTGSARGSHMETSTGNGSNGSVRGRDAEGLERSGNFGGGKDWTMEGLGSNGGAEDCIFGGLKSCSAVNGGRMESNGSYAADSRSEGPEGCGGAGDSDLHGVKSNCMGKDCSVEGLRSNAADRDESVDDSLCSDIVAEDTKMEGLKTNGAAKACTSEGLQSNRFTGETKGAAKQCNLKGLKGGVAAKDCFPAAKGGSLAGSGCKSSAMNCRKGQKALVPWRFQIGYMRSFSKAFCSNNGSSGSLGTPEFRVQDGSKECAPATGSAVWWYASVHSNVRVSAMCDFSIKDQKETSTAYKKRKTGKDDHNQKMPNNGVVLTRDIVMGSLREFQTVYRNLLEEQECNSREAGHRPDLVAFKIFRERFCKNCDDRKYVGSVPGIQIGDVFHLRVELCIVGIHRPHRIGVDYIKEDDGACRAVSIVSYAHYSDVKNNLDVFVYSGSMTATGNQKIDGTNLALKRSMDTNTPVRVIHGFITSLSENCRPKKLATYIYGGLYLVEKYWREKESEDRHVYMFRLQKMAGQKHVDIQEILRSRKPEPYYVIYMEDISQGSESIPISVVNSMSNEYPMPFQYMSRLRYPPKCQPDPPAGCDCVDGCSDSEKCACVVKNGGEIPFNEKGRIVEAKPLVYECGPSCKCPPTCHNRVSQRGMKFRLQIFKTKLMGWGVRSLDFIPSGSFVCEYIGEVLEDEEAQKRMNDEYLFAIGNNYYNESLWEGLSRSIPSLEKGPSEDEEVGYAVDASIMGNFARFINHSCTPNLYAQNVLYDHDDKSMPHIMFFASEDIPPLQELAYHYNYTIDQVHDVNGNIKKKKCLCGSIECDRWLY